MYFSTCHLLSEDLSAIERVEWDHRFSECSHQSEVDELRSQVSVGTLKFVLYLYVQQLHKVSLKASLVAGDEWPSLKNSQDLESSGRSTPRGNKTLDDHSHMLFIQHNIQEILELLVEPENYSQTHPGESALTVEAVEAMGFLIAGSVDKCRSLVPLHDIAILQTVQHKSGFSKITRTFNLRKLSTWLKDCMVQNPFGISSCIANGRRLSWPMAGEDKEAMAESTTKRGKIATNAHVVPKEQARGNKIIIMSQVSKQTIARSSGTIDGSSVKIHRSHYSYLYLLSPLRSVTIEKCRNTTIVLGPIEIALYISHCENLTVISVARNVMISGSTSCTLHLLTPNRPVILGGNDSILLAPYHTFYGTLEEQMSKSGIGVNRNLWDQPLCIGPDHKDTAPIWETLSTQDFFTFNIPFEVAGRTQSIPMPLPPKYQKAISQRQKHIDSWQKTVKESGLSKEQRKEFQKLVESRFHVWLSETGHKLSRFWFTLLPNGSDDTIDTRSEETHRDGETDPDGDLVLTRRADGQQEEWNVLTIAHFLATELKDVGKQLWCGSLLLADYLIHIQGELNNKTVVELGAGTALASIVASFFAKSVLCTDIGEDVLRLAEHNLDQNWNCLLLLKEKNYCVCELDWTSSGLVAVIYDDKLTSAFFNTIYSIMLNPPSKSLYISLEKRYIFTLEDRDVVAPAYDYFRECLEALIKSTSDTGAQFHHQEIPVTFPQFFTYNRTKEMILCKIYTTFPDR
ncbi:TBCC domain-containing protein 1-like isoform X2 [Ostrea edulis]|uniref:TBCC domain-containing protein 1-like isoform X2 n=1 Tax=Ostrea edulis TaxID=37623 RepID=UPI0024AEB682|nr:TBCC domain-containing protein 1-like isoform X2 [Ostrea edulis]